MTKKQKEINGGQTIVISLQGEDNVTLAVQKVFYVRVKLIRDENREVE